MEGDYAYFKLVEVDPPKEGKVTRGLVHTEENIPTCGKEGFIATELLRGFADVVDYMLTWMGDCEGAEFDPEAFDAYIKEFERNGRPRDPETIQSMENLESLVGSGTEFSDGAKAKVPDEFMQELRDFSQCGKDIIAKGKIPILIRYTTGDEEDY